MAEPRQLVLVGGGHAHVFVLEAWARRPVPGVRLTVVADLPVAIYSGLVPACVAGFVEPRAAELDLSALVAAAGARLVLAHATGLDREARAVLLRGGEPVPYDLVSFDVGSTVRGLGLDGVTQHALPTRPIGAFLERLDALLSGPPPGPRLVVVGAGAAGLELALCARARGAASVVVIEAGPEPLASFPARARRLLQRSARARAVELRTGVRVTSVQAQQVLLEGGERVPCDAVIWAAGPAPHDLFERTGLALHAGYVCVGPTLQSPTDGRVFAAGDCAWLLGHELPRMGVHAVRQGPVLTRNLMAHLRGQPLAAWRPQADVLRLMNLGDGTALGCKWGLTVSGRWVARWKTWLDTSFMRRFTVPPGASGPAAD